MPPPGAKHRSKGAETIRRGESVVPCHCVASAVVWLATICAACGRWGYERGPGSGSGSGGSSGALLVDSGMGPPTPDAAVADAGGPPLDDLGPFGVPSIIAAFAAPGEANRGPTFTADRTLLYFSSSRAGGAGAEDLYYSVRLAPSDPWQAPRLSLQSTAARELTPGISGDGLTLWFSSDRAGPGACARGGGADIWSVARSDRGVDFGGPACVEELSSPADDLAPAPSPDGLSLVLTVDDGSFSQLYLARRGSAAEAWSALVPLAELGGAFDVARGVLAREARELFFAGDRDEPGAPRLATSRRSSPAAAFGSPASLDELNGPGSDRDPWVSSDARYIIWASDRSGSEQLYEASR